MEEGGRRTVTRATVEHRTARLGQTLRAGRRLVGGLSFHGVSELCTNSLAHRLPGGIQAQELRIQAQGMRRRPMQAWVSCSGGRATAWDLHAVRDAQCGELRGPDLEHR